MHLLIFTQLSDECHKAQGSDLSVLQTFYNGVNNLFSAMKNTFQPVEDTESLEIQLFGDRER